LDDETHTSKLSVHIHETLSELGWEFKTKEERDTPKRFAKYLQYFHHETDYANLLQAQFEIPKGDSDVHGIVTQGPIPFRAVCAHHLLPMIGTAHVAYIPGQKVVGLSKLARLVRCVGRERPSKQEVIGERITDLLMRHLHPLGAMTIIRAEHCCMAARGLDMPGIHTTTANIRGAFRDNQTARDEAYRLINIS